MATSVGNFLLKQMPGSFLLHDDRVGIGAYMLSKSTLSCPLKLGSKSICNHFFPPEKEHYRKDVSFLDSWSAKKITNTNQLAAKVFDIVISLLIFVPVTLASQQIVSYMGFGNIRAIQTPLQILLKEQVKKVVLVGILTHILGSICSELNEINN